MLKLTFISDTHHYSKTLGTTGRQYFLRSGSDQKCLAETGEIIDSAFDKIAKSDTDAVMIIGDVTNDGEKISHIEFKEKLEDDLSLVISEAEIRGMKKDEFMKICENIFDSMKKLKPQND